MFPRKMLLPLAVAAAALPAVAAAASSSTTLRYYDKPTRITLAHPDGTTTANPTAPPAAGDKLDIYSLDYRGTRQRHATRATGSSHTVCTFTAADGPPSCDSDVELGNGLLVFDGDKIVGGTRHYRGASGSSASTAVLDNDNSSNVTIHLKLG